MSRSHWTNCIAHFDDEVGDFVESYFGENHRRCILIAAAGFSPRTKRIATMLARVMGNRLEAYFVREERRTPDVELFAAAEANERTLRGIISRSQVIRVDVFGDDGAAIGGPRIAAHFGNVEIGNHITDVVLDMTALSIGIWFPIARMLLEGCEAAVGQSFHILNVSNPELDDCITRVPTDTAMPVKGFAGLRHLSGSLEPARIWVPQLASGRKRALSRIGLAVGDCYKICPVLPFPARDPRRADNLIMEYETELIDEWQVDPRDLIYVSERNPLDCYRMLTTLKERYDRIVCGTYEPHIIISPMGSKVMATGALMAAIEHDLTVQYVETLRYEYLPLMANERDPGDMLVHVLLSGPVYRVYDAVTNG